ncbi:MAG: type II and III secretion system protein, partial [Verrucomicrobiales bacterium]|nr:type II and III secretion system protein [Verrucomicrobiales bacterium]
MIFTLVSTQFAPLGLAQGEAAGKSQEGTAAGIASRHVQRLQEQVKKADDLVTQGGRLQANGMNKEAMEIYKTAVDLLPAIPATSQRRRAYFKRYQSSAAAYAQTLVDQGEFKQANAALDEVYKTAANSTDLPPSAISIEVSTLKKKLNNNHFNPALTPRHLSNVRSVEQLLREAEGAFGLADFDLAEKKYHAVLTVDRFNAAARRGLEMVERMRSEYHRLSKSHARAHAFRKIAEGWELPVPVTASLVGSRLEYSNADIRSNQAVLEKKLKQLIIPSLEFDQARLADVVEFLNQKSQQIDDLELDPAKKGVNFIIDTSQAADAPERPVTIRLNNVPLESALKYIAQLVGMKYRVEEFAVTLVPLTDTGDSANLTRSWQVPPYFLSGDNAGGGAPANADPFAEPDPGGAGGTLVKRVSAQQFLEDKGVVFGPGAIARFNPATSTLFVRNKPDQIALVEALVLASREAVSQIIKVDVRMISVSLEGTRELGFDWLLGASNLDPSNRYFGSGGTFSNATNNRAPGDFPFVSPAGNPIGQNPITAGIRSGRSNETVSIDELIARQNPTTGVTGQANAAPGLFALSGVFTDPQYQMVLRGINQIKNTDRLCEASVVVRPGERATIRQVREFIYPTEYDPPELPNSVGVTQVGGIQIQGDATSFPVTPANPTAFEMRELGKIIEVEPVVGGDNRSVNLSLTTDFSDFVGFINYGTPITTVRPTGFIGFTTLTLTENRILMPVFD